MIFQAGRKPGCAEKGSIVLSEKFQKHILNRCEPEVKELFSEEFRGRISGKRGLIPKWGSRPRTPAEV